MTSGDLPAEVPQSELQDIRTVETFSPETFMHIIGIQCRWHEHSIGANATLSEECYRRYQNDPSERLFITEMLMAELRRQAARLRPPLDPPQRRLRAVWSREAQQDLRAMHNLDAEAMLTELMGLELQGEMSENVTIVGNNRVWQGGYKGQRPEFLIVDWKTEGF